MANDTMISGQTLPAGNPIYSSDGRYELIMQTDGNLVEYDTKNPEGVKPVWASNTQGSGAVAAVMQPEGKLALYTADALKTRQPPLWSSGGGSAGDHLIVQNDGNVVLYSPDNASLWDTGQRSGFPPFQVTRETHRPGLVSQIVHSLKDRYDTVTTQVRKDDGTEIVKLSADEYDVDRTIHIDTPDGVHCQLLEDGTLRFPGWRGLDDIKVYPGEQFKIGDAVVKPVFRYDAVNAAYKKAGQQMVTGVEVVMNNKKLTLSVSDDGKPAALYGKYTDEIKDATSEDALTTPQWDSSDHHLIRNPEIVLGRDGLYLPPQLGISGGKIVQKYEREPAGVVGADNGILFDPSKLDQSKHLPG